MTTFQHFQTDPNAETIGGRVTLNGVAYDRADLPADPMAETTRNNISIRMDGMRVGADAPVFQHGPSGDAALPKTWLGNSTQAINTYAPVNENDVSDVSDVEPFASSEEVAAAMADPRYSRSPLYRQAVNRRLAAG